MTLTAFADSYIERRNRLSQQMRNSGKSNVRLAKETSNLFRDRVQVQANQLTVRDFNHLLEVNQDQDTILTEAMITYGDLVDATLSYGYMPIVVPQLKSITIGGAVAGIGIESTSFRHGLPHERVYEMDVLLADGTAVRCSADNEHSDLFYGIPNSYGTLGYVLSLKSAALPVRPYVRVEHVKYQNAEEFFQAILEVASTEIDFLDGSVYGTGEYYLTTGSFVDSVPYTSDYTYLDIYYKSILQKQEDYLTTKDYIWRWDTDWFWCSKNLYVQNGLMRRLVGQKRLNSTTYTKVMRWNSKWGVTRRLNSLTGYHAESVIQDIDIPIHNAAEFLAFLIGEIGVLPIWICPILTSETADRFPFFSMEPNSMYINFGFWDSVKSKTKHPPGYLNQKIERKTIELGGIKSLYSDSFFEEEEFWRIYKSEDYWQLKRKYDPGNKFLNIYEKCVLRK